ncbi:MAG: hypothetical protein NTW50_00610 [Candidatus Berkelbacteria bacterium]|nr:hypothetical protein [Candidatus Berkelbacteria bacterium]
MKRSRKVVIWLISLVAFFFLLLCVWDSFLMYNPKLTFYFFAKNRENVKYDRPPISDVFSTTTATFVDNRLDGEINFESPKTKISFRIYPRGTVYSGKKLSLTNPVIATLVKPGLSFLRPAKNPKRFRNFIQAQTEEIFEKDDFIGRSFEAGDFFAFYQVVMQITGKNMRFEPAAKVWRRPNKAGQDVFKLAWANPIRGFVSADGESIDSLLIDRHDGVCRHYAEATFYVSEELKKIYKGKFDNFYLTTVLYPQKWHEASIACAVTEKNSVIMVPFDLTNYFPTSPAFTIVEEMYLRRIISKEVFNTIVFEYSVRGGRMMDEDLGAYLDFALSQSDRSSIKFAELAYLIKNQQLNYETGADYSQIRHYAVKIYKKTGQFPVGPLTFHP